MKIILLQNINSLGKAGDVKDVSEGYARNFLLPKKLAAVATEEAIRETEAKKSAEKAIENTQLEKLRQLAKKLKDHKIILKSRAKGKKLFGSITVKNIIAEMEKADLAVSEKSIIIKEAIKKTGEYEIKIVLAPGIETKIKLEVTGE
ncbi:MAG: 50S ribosomal protein L9 [Candidatus Moranbacteria bacterium RIFOXYA12_FULL_44_15]|nr:MAG: 50S ribosomal protein L9 [Candidatus Moranbacteria bacterium RIFOXYA12_FULL_44_15]OGI36187.1 MAG: 50S ribosomal protein L9 [Candidatus Moranbacteria bacterium RIFOXYA2_FULL_43_15]